MGGRDHAVLAAMHYEDGHYQLARVEAPGGDVGQLVVDHPGPR